MAQLIRTDGTITSVQPDGHEFTLDEIYRVLACRHIEALHLHDGRVMYFDGLGRVTDPPKPPNLDAMALALPTLPNGGLLGDVLLCEHEEEDL